MKERAKLAHHSPLVWLKMNKLSKSAHHTQKIP